jgi:hypothetical protein
VFAWPSQRPLNREAPASSRLPRHSNLKYFPRNYAKIAEKSETIGESNRSGQVWEAV